MTDEQRVLDLERRLSEIEQDSQVDLDSRIDVLNELAWILVDTDHQRARALSESAYVLSSASEAGRPAYPAGQAYSLRTLGYLNQRLGNYPLGLSQLFKAQEIAESQNIEAALPDILDGMAGISAQIGDYPEALNFMFKQLDAAQRTGDQRLIANAYNNLANIYLETGGYERAIDTLRANLEFAAETGYHRIVCLSHLNLAETYLRAGRYREALEYGLGGLPACQVAGFELFEVYAYDILGKTQMKLGDHEQALAYFENALALSGKMNSKVTESLILLNIGRAYQEMGRLDQAGDYFRKCLTVARAIEAKAELFQAHLHLSEIYEKLGDYASALAHFKQHHAIKEQVFNEKADQRLKVLEVAYDTAAARKEAEISHQKTRELEQEISERRKVEAALQEARDMLEEQVKNRTSELSSTVARLQNEIAERERAEAEIQQLVETLEQRVAARTEELVTFFDLILLGGEADTPTDVIEPAMPRILEVTRSQAVCIHFYDTEHAVLRLAAQQNLSEAARGRSQTVELTPGFQRWLQQPNDPLIVTDVPQQAILPTVLQPLPSQTYLGVQIRIGKRVEGILSCYRSADQGYGLDDIALIIALAEQTGMMLENHRLRQNAEEMAVSEERQRLARDLHDSVTQSLYSLSLFSRAGREAAEDGDRERLMYSLTELERNTLHALREMRLLLYELRPADLEQGGLIPAIELRLNTVERRVGLQLEVDLAGYAGMPPACEIQLYHIIVEALNNVVKHAAASRLTLKLSQIGGQLHLRIADDGQGFDPQQVEGGMGLRNIRERVARLDGQLSLSSRPGSGTQLEIEIPCREEASQ